MIIKYYKKRFWAFCIDVGISSLLGQIILSKFAFLLNFWLNAKSPIHYIQIGLLYFFVTMICYSTLSEFISSMTIGKYVLGLKVKSESGNLKFHQILIRNVAKPFDFVFIIGALLILFTANSRRLGDLLAGTKVVVK